MPRPPRSLRLKQTRFRNIASKAGATYNGTSGNVMDGFPPTHGRSTPIAQGRFQLRGIPAGVYQVYARGEVHNLEDDNRRIEVKEGGRVEIDLALKPQEPFLELNPPTSRVLSR